MVSSRSLTQAIGQSYRELPYESRAFRETHPGYLAAIGRVFGITPASVYQCRVLELGCASGGNLIPMAAGLPASQFVGVDLAPNQIQQGQAQIERLQLTNIRLQAADLCDIDASWGQFDYIIAHGLYSWVPEPVQQTILAICRDRLTEQGIAYISYNTYPGWHLRGIVRDVLRLSLSDQGTPQQRVQAARRFAQALSQIDTQRAAAPQQAYRLLLKQELQRLQCKRDSYLFHEYLEPVNTPVYFCEFVNQLAQYDLQYLAEAAVSSMFEDDLCEHSQRQLLQLAPDLIAAEQCLDVIRNRMFRQTLLCHRAVPLQRCLRAETLADLGLCSAARPTVPCLPQDQQTVDFVTPDGATVCTPHPATKAALQCLAESYPRVLPFSDLWSLVAARVPTASRRELALELLRCFSAEVVTLLDWLPSCTGQVSELPLASAVSRDQARMGRVVTNCHHQSLTLSETARQVLLHLDGSCDRNTLSQRCRLPGATVEATLLQLAESALLIQ